MDPAIGTAGWAIGAVLAAVQWRSMRALRESMVRIAHELRGPLAAARLGVELGARTGEITSVRLRAIEAELARAAAVLDELGHPRQRAQAGRREAVPIATLLRDSVEAHQALAAQRATEIQLKWSGGQAAVWGDRVRLSQAADNLIANALEHGGGEVRVRGHVRETTVRIEVSDGGGGLPGPVGELTRRARGGRGTRGRGLAIASGVAAEHGGRLAAAPSERGARLVLELPVLGAVGKSQRPTVLRRFPM